MRSEVAKQNVIRISIWRAEPRGVTLHQPYIIKNATWANGDGNKREEMPDNLTLKEKQVLELLIELAGGINRPVRFRILREAGFPEKISKIYDDNSDYLDSLANRKLQKLRDKGWITMEKAVNTVLYAP